jgi:OPA family glycerol-3-phosphate transporter-like MFS transporter
MAATQLRLIGSDPRYERWRLQVFAATWLAYFGFYLTRKSFSVAKVVLVKPEVMGWSKGDLAKVDAAYLTAYALGQFAFGMLGDRVGARRVLLAGMLASVVTAILMGASSAVVLFGVLFAVQGICQSTGWSPLAKTLAAFFSQRERGRVLGFWCTSYAAGGVLGSWLAGRMADLYGWRYAFWVPAGCLLLVWVLFYALQRNRPEDVGLPPIEQYHGEPEAVLVPEEMPAEEREGSWELIGAVMRNKMVLLLAVVYFLVKAPRYLFLFWSPLYVHERLGAGAEVSGMLGSLPEFASPLAVLLGGYLSDRVFQSRRIPMSVIGLVGAAILMLSFSYLPATPLALGLGLFGIGVLLNIPDSLVSGAAVIDFGTKKGASTAAGFVNGWGSIGALIGGTAPGWMANITGRGPGAWQAIFLALGGALALATALLIPKWNALPPTAAETEAPGTDKHHELQ